MEYIAHTENPEGKLHSLKKHLLNTAELAKSFAHTDLLRELCSIEGMVHDLGKYLKDFQLYLIQGGRRGSVPHSKYGAILYRFLSDQLQMPWAKEISFCIGGHHGGLPDFADWKQNLTDSSDEKVQNNYKTIFPVFLDDLKLDKTQLYIQSDQSDLDIFDQELITRFLFSCLTDADWLDTERHFQSAKYESRRVSILEPSKLITIMDTLFSQFPNVGEINHLRNQVRDHAVSKAGNKTGFFSLNLPTGMGKTLTSVYWALKHAEANKLKRIIIVLPFVNIIDQTAQILKDIFADDLVLEHHSGVSEHDDYETLYDVRKLACENWDYPIIITTTVQFFESLFSNKPSKCRKIHNIAESVTIFDEVQSLPKELLLPTLTMLKNINGNLNTSFLFCTATLPAFQKRSDFDGLDYIEPLVKDPAHLYQKTKRVEYELIENLEPIDSIDLYNSVKNRNTAALVVFNTKIDAFNFYREAESDKNSWDAVFHLSTAMCPVHRKKIITEIREALRKNKKILVASTQLIEAGVDFDFPSVYRAIAPLDSIIQTAGRCNREGKMKNLGKAYIFKLSDNRMPDKTYNAISVHAGHLIRNNLERLQNHDFYSEYYEQIMSLYIDPDSKNINEDREQYKFASIAKQYHIIDSPTQSLFVYKYNETSKELFEELEKKEKLTKTDFRKMQLYSVQVYASFIHNFKEWIEELPQGYMVWHGAYDDTTGISMKSSVDVNMIL